MLNKIRRLIVRCQTASDAGQTDFIAILIIVGLVLVIGGLAWAFLVPALKHLFSHVGHQINKVKQNSNFNTNTF